MDPLKTIYTSDTSETEAAGAALATEMLSNPSIPRLEKPPLYEALLRWLLPTASFALLPLHW